MKCIYCDAKTSVLSTREGVFRTRRCKGPDHHKFATTEMSGPELKRNVAVSRTLSQIRILLKNEGLDM
jgi:hypothetical protein